MLPWVVPLAMLVVPVALAVTAMLLVRRHLVPSGGYFRNHNTSAGAFGVVGTAYAVLLAFVIFSSFASYQAARSAAGEEAVAVGQLSATTAYFAPQDRRDLQGELVCYARAVVRDEWPAMRRGQESTHVNAWTERLDASVDQLRVVTGKQQVAFAHWLDESALRLEGRRGRIAEATPFVPPFVWVVLGIAGTIVILFVLFFADPAERVLGQVLLMAAVATAVLASLVLVAVLDRPYTYSGVAISPSRMAGAVQGTEEQLRLTDPGAVAPCADDGRPTSAA